MNLNNFLCFLVLSFLCLPVCAQFEFDGQLLGQTSLGLEKQSSKFIGARYLPSLNFKKKQIVCLLLLFRFQEILVLLNF